MSIRHISKAKLLRPLAAIMAFTMLFSAGSSTAFAAGKASQKTDSLSVSGSFKTSGEVKRYSVKLPSDGLLNVKVTPDGANCLSGKLFECTITDGSGEVYAGRSLMGGEASSEFRVGLGKGEYTLKLRCDAFDKAADGFSITADFTASDACETEFNDNISTADVLSADKVFTGAINTEIDRDFYKLSTASLSAPELLFEGGTGSGAWEISVLNGAKKQLAHQVCKGGKSVSVSIPNTAAYVSVVPVTYSQTEYRMIVRSGKPVVERLAGSSRIETAVEISRSGWSSAGSVLIANGFSFADALASIPLSAALDAPVLLTANNNTPEYSVMAEVKRLGAKNIYILGGTSVVGENIEKKLAALGHVERIAGSDRFETAVKIAEKLRAVSGKAPEAVFFASSTNFPDALSAGPIAAHYTSPILYIAPNAKVDTVTETYVSGLKNVNAVILGGKAAVTDKSEDSIKAMTAKLERISGSDRYDTAAKLYERYRSIFTGKDVSAATGKSFPDALAGGALSAKLSIPMLLVGGANENSNSGIIREKAPDRLFVYGGTSAVSENIIDALA